jgi:ferredoxin
MEAVESAESTEVLYTVLRERCFPCAACVTAAPGTFAMDDVAARVKVQPAAAAERARAEAARIQCPGHAISREGGAPAPHAVGEAASEPLFPRLFAEAERVRWRMVDVPWGSIERGWVTPAFLRFVREVALSELTTFSATKRFLTEMADDPDFSSWVAIWFYEETKHPEALFQWLAAFGVQADSRAVLRGRVTAPFLRSKVGTLVMNVLSELFASAGYQDLARYTKEPVLAHIFRGLAGDEARHGASFYAYAERAIAQSKSPDLERLQALKVLYYWVRAADHVEHPVNQFHEKVSADPELLSVLRDVGTDYGPVLARACRLIGTLIGLPLPDPDDVLPALRERSAALGQAV